MLLFPAVLRDCLAWFGHPGCFFRASFPGLTPCLLHRVGSCTRVFLALLVAVCVGSWAVPGLFNLRRVAQKCSCDRLAHYYVLCLNPGSYVSQRPSLLLGCDLVMQFPDHCNTSASANRNHNNLTVENVYNRDSGTANQHYCVEQRA